MTTLLLWKLKRELNRAFGQMLAGPSYFVQYLAATPYYDRVLARQRKIHVGAIPLKDRVAVYLIFPKNGLLPTHLRAIGYLLDNGYAPLPEADRQRLQPVSARLIERANFGYDFGGYRDAILSLEPQIATLEVARFSTTACDTASPF